jgi:prepilin-type N-terminal cleavage/methylation domain-containing protein
MNKSQSGFTLVELVVVILILGILGATALPRFMNVSTQAHEAAVSGAGGGFGAGIALLHAQWVANGSALGATDLDDVAGFGDGLNASGWPTDTSGVSAITLARCVEVWNGIMQNPPLADSAANPDADYIATLPTASSCLFTYQPANTMSITYDSNDGSVTVDDII